MLQHRCCQIIKFSTHFRDYREAFRAAQLVIYTKGHNASRVDALHLVHESFDVLRKNINATDDYNVLNPPNNE